MKTISIIGGGNMGEAILKGIVRSHKVVVAEKDSARASFLRKTFKVKTADISTAVSRSDVVILAVKPQDMETLLPTVALSLSKKHLVISIAAGITTAYLQKKLGKKCCIVRTMPNLPAKIGSGVTAIAKGKYATTKDVKTAAEIFNHVGATVVLKENLLDAVTAVSGSGPAYVFLFVEYLIKAARSLGLKEHLSRELVLKTLMGSAKLLSQQNIDPEVLRKKVTSKGGTTQAALDVFAKYQTGKIFQTALRAAKIRARQLSRR